MAPKAKPTAARKPAPKSKSAPTTPGETDATPPYDDKTTVSMRDFLALKLQVDTLDAEFGRRFRRK